jgi:hypothetical protein
MPLAHILLTQDPATRAGIPEADMKRKYPKTFAYLKQFEAMLRQRSGFRKYYKPSDPFYALYNVGPYTLAPWKVLWPEVANNVKASVCGPADGGVAIPDHTLIAVPCTSGDEAHYLCALLNAAPGQLAASAYIVLHPSPHVLEHIAIPKFAPDNTLHARLAELSRLRHAAEADPAAPAEDKAALDQEIDRAARSLWNLSETELAAIQNALKKVERIRPAPCAEDESEETEGAQE